MKYVLMFCDTPELYGQVDEVAAKAVHEEVWAWFGEHDAAGRIADMGRRTSSPSPPRRR